MKIFFKIYAIISFLVSVLVFVLAIMTFPYDVLEGVVTLFSTIDYIAVGLLFWWASRKDEDIYGAAASGSNARKMCVKLENRVASLEKTILELKKKLAENVNGGSASN